MLNGLEGRLRQARHRLLIQLFDAGVSLDQLKEAVAQERLVILPAEHALGASDQFSARQLCEATGVPLEFFLGVRRAHGLTAADPDEVLYGEQDREAAEVIAGFYEAGLDQAAMLEAARVLGRGMAQLADALGEVFGQTFIKAGVTEEELGLRTAQAAGEMLPRVGVIVEYALRQHMRERLRHQAVSQAMLEAGQLPGAREVAVAFADMVAFTPLSERLEPEAVGGIAGRLGEMASDCAAPPVRLVKLIGDAAMLVAPDPGPLVEATLDLISEAERVDDFPVLRAGAALGPALTRSGDWYGHPVNVASRLVGAADPGTLAGTEELRTATRGSFQWTAAGTHALKGIDGRIAVFRAAPGS